MSSISELIMKHSSLWLLTSLFFCVQITSVSAQSGRAKDPGAAPSASEANKPGDAKPVDPTDSRNAAQLFEEADNYTQKKFAEFEKLKMPYDDQLEAKIRKEQQEMAARYASLLTTRKPEGKDVYYLGLLYNLAKNFDSALETMRRFLVENPSATGEPAQNARAIVVIQAAKKGLLTEAETRLAEYAKDQPQSADDRYALENWVTSGYFKLKDYERALSHALEMWSAAKLSARKKSPFERDRVLNEAMTMLTEIDLKLQKKDAAVAAVQDLRNLALALPSGNLYKLALRRLSQIDPTIDPFKTLDYADGAAITPPDLTADEWIDQQPTRLSQLRGRVVLLDFWAPWCFPCRVTFPRLQKFHENYRDKGLVILGVTNFFGHAEGKELTRAQELNYLRGFKKKFRLPYGFVIADSEENDRNYGVSSIPTTFLIDRRGVVRFISIGSSVEENSALSKMIKKLIEEPAAGTEAAAPATGEAEKKSP